MENPKAGNSKLTVIDGGAEVAARNPEMADVEVPKPLLAHLWDLVVANRRRVCKDENHAERR